MDIATLLGVFGGFGVLYMAVAFSLINLLVDLSYLVLDPRVRY